MIAIIGAMKIETDSIREKMTDVALSNVGNIEIAVGKLNGVDVALLRCGVGKVAAGAATAVAIERFSPSLVINVGVAGGFGDLKPFDVVLPEYAVEHDMDTSVLGDPVGYLSDLQIVKIPLHAQSIEKIRQSCSVSFHGGVLASGDIFVAEEDLKTRLQDTFGATCCDMEGASIAHVCAIFGVPCIVLRTISDSGDGCDFLQFVKTAAKECADIMYEGISAL